MLLTICWRITLQKTKWTHPVFYSASLSKMRKEFKDRELQLLNSIVFRSLALVFYLVDSQLLNHHLAWKWLNSKRIGAVLAIRIWASSLSWIFILINFCFALLAQDGHAIGALLQLQWNKLAASALKAIQHDLQSIIHALKLLRIEILLLANFELSLHLLLRDIQFYPGFNRHLLATIFIHLY